MARIVDKDEKRLNIAQATIDLFYEKGMHQTSMDDIAKSAGVAKGTIYLYFKNKEEIMFAIWDMLSGLHKEAFARKVRPSMSAKEKILLFYNFQACIPESDHYKIISIYQNFVSAMLIDKTGLYATYFENFFKEDFIFITKTLKEAVSKGELEIENIEMLANVIIVFMKGISIKAKTLNLSFKETQHSLTSHLIYILEQCTRKAL